MKMKRFAYFGLIAIAVLMAGYSCGNDGTTSEDNEEILLYLALAKNEPYAVILPYSWKRDTVIALGWVAYAGTDNYRNGKINAALSADQSLIAAYNAAHASNYLLLPDDCYSIDYPVVTIADGTRFSQPANLTLQSAKLDESKRYLLPVTVSISPSSALPLDETQKTAWWMIWFEEEPGTTIMEKDTWEVIEWSSFWDNGGNYLPDFVIDGNINSYWHSNADGNAQDKDLPQWLIIDMQKYRLLSGIEIWNRQDGSPSSPKNIVFELSRDKETWVTLIDVPALTPFNAAEAGQAIKLIANSPQTGRYLRVTVVTTYDVFYTFIAEITPY